MMQSMIRPINTQNPEDTLKKINKLFEKAKNTPQPGAPGPSKDDKPPEIKPPQDMNKFWIIHNVEYKGSKQSYVLLKELLPRGTQDEHIERAKIAMPKGGFFIPNYQLLHSIIIALYSQRDNPKTEEIRAFIDKQAKLNWLMTLTRVRYTPKGLDKIIHDCGLPIQFEEDVDFTGPYEFVKDTKTPNIYKALLGSDNTQEITEIYSWLCNVQPKLYRLNSKPTQNIEERIARFFADSGRVLLDCDFDRGNSYSGLGLRPILTAEGGSQKQEVI